MSAMTCARAIGILIVLLSVTARVGGIEPEDLVPVTFVNRSGREIVQLFVSPRASRSWGAGLLNATRRLPDGGRATFYLHGGDGSAYDILAVDSSEDAYLIWNRVWGPDAPAVLEITASDLEGGYDRPRYGSVRVINRSGSAVWYLFFSVLDSPLRGADMLDAGTILEDGEALSIIMPVFREVERYEIIALDSAHSVFQTTVDVSDATVTQTIVIDTLNTR
jgi:hypothetical protein